MSECCGYEGHVCFVTGRPPRFPLSPTPHARPTPPQGFERLFEFIDDLELDTPGATEITAAFLARAVVDDIIPPAVS